MSTSKRFSPGQALTVKDGHIDWKATQAKVEELVDPEEVEGIMTYLRGLVRFSGSKTAVTFLQADDEQKEQNNE